MSSENTDNSTTIFAEPPRAMVYELAGRAGIDPRTARKALLRGPASLRNVADRERTSRALRDLGIDAPLSAGGVR